MRLPHSQIAVVWCGGAGQALHVGVGEAGHVEVLLRQQVGAQQGHQGHGGLGLEQHHEGLHAQLGWELPLQEQAHGDFLDLRDDGEDR